MTRTLLLTVSAALLAAATNAAASQPPSNSAAFERLKTLTGDWEASHGDAKSHLTYELIAGGSAIVERESTGNMPAMMTVYYLDGDRLLLTHYCMAGNQPRMQSRAYDAAAGDLAFDFLDATNLANPRAGHMHSAVIHFIDKDHFSASWQFYENGKQKFVETAQYARIK